MNFDVILAEVLALDLRILLSVAAGLGLLLGLLLYFLVSRPARLRREAELQQLRAEIQTETAKSAERALALTQAEQRLATSFRQLANDSFAQHSENFLRLARESLGKHHERAKAELGDREQAVEALVKPIREALDKTHEQIGAIEKARHESFGNIRAQLENMGAAQETLRTETHRLVKALRRPEVRGQWGELTLRRLVELAGMVEHCDFDEQISVGTEDGNLRPDLLVHLPERGTIVVDVKTPLDAYLEAIEAEDDTARKTALVKHARNVANRVRELASKSYWSQFERSPEFVILFIPGDQFLSAALNEAPNLLEDAMRDRVILATPSSLVALLKAVAFGWRQLTLADNAEVIRGLAQDLYGRLAAFSSHLVKLGKQLEGGVKAYNNAVGSLERKVLPGVRKFTELGVQAKTEIPALGEVEEMLRSPADLSAKDTDPPAVPPPPANDTAGKTDKVTKRH